MKHPAFKRITRNKKTWIYALLIGTTCLLTQAPSAYAGKEGVFLANDTYFTLETVQISSGVQSSTVQFVLNLHNGGQSFVDFNQYGVRLVDDQGNRYPAKLTSKQTARVALGHDRQFRFYSEVAPGLKPEQLKVHLYEWNAGQPDAAAAAGLGDLSVAAALSSSGSEVSGQLLVSLHDINSSYRQEAFVSIRSGNSYPISESGKPYLYTDLYVQNGGSSSVQLPANLQFRLKGADSTAYLGSIAGGNTETLLPNKMTKITIRTAVPDLYDPELFILEAFYEDSSEERVLGSFPVSGTYALSSVGTEQPFGLYGTGNGLTVSADKAVAIKQADGYLVQTTVTVRNSSTRIAALPSLSAAYQFGLESIAATGQDQSVRSGFLSPGQAATYRYALVLPEGINPTAANFALFEQKSSSAGTSPAAANTAGNSGGSQTQASTNNTANQSSGAGSSPGTGASTNSGSGTGSSSSSGSSSGSNSNSNSGSGSGNNSSGTNSSTGSGKSGSSDQTPVLLVSLIDIEQADNMFRQALFYQAGSPFAFAPNGVIDKSLEVSLVELHMHETSDFGYSTAVAKYKLTNRGTGTIAMPNLGTELLNTQGLAFAGERQAGAADKIAPNTSYVVSYSYLLPAEENGKQLVLNFTDPKSTSAAKLSFGSYQVAVQPESSDDRISFYPFEVGFDDYRISTLYSSGNYTYRLDLTLNVNMKETVIVDQNFSQMEFELVDGLNRILGSQTMAFTGTSKLVSGYQRVAFANIKTEQFENNLVVNVYETINTPSGPAKRLVKQLKQ